MNKIIYITKFDWERLNKLLEAYRNSNFRGREYLATLQAELNRAKVLDAKIIPPDVVTMNTKVCLADQKTGEEEIYTLVFPEESNIKEQKISILAPIGTAMLGYRVGDIFEWKVPAGTRSMLVKEVLYQPEAAGDYHL